MPPERQFDLTAVSFPAGIPGNRPEHQSSLKEDMEFLQNLGRIFFPPESWSHLSDEEIVKLSEHEMNCHRAAISILGEEVRNMLGKWIPMLVPPDHRNDFKWMDIWVALTAGARISLTEECRRRLTARTGIPQRDAKGDWDLAKAV